MVGTCRSLWAEDFRRFLDRPKTGSVSSRWINGPPPRPIGVRAIRRFVLIASVALLGGCAGDSTLRQELSSLRGDLRALRQANERMEQRIARLEDRDAVASAAKVPKSSEQPSTSGSEVPELTVVKIKPRTDEAPSLDVSTDIQEPPLDQVAGLGRKRDGLDEGAVEAGEAKDPSLVEAEFEDAVIGLKTGSFSSAVLKLQAFASAYPRHPRSDNALYFSGIGLLALDDAEGAARAFDQAIAEYPAGDARLEAMLKLAECRVRLDQKDGARELYARILSTYPGTHAAAQARQRLTQLSR